MFARAVMCHFRAWSQCSEQQPRFVFCELSKEK